MSTLRDEAMEQLIYDIDRTIDKLIEIKVDAYRLAQRPLSLSAEEVARRETATEEDPQSSVKDPGR